jgi:metal-responsive CopG/Arc/MetJ family transcriptional regulator
MATEPIKLPEELITKVNEAAAKEGISPEELVRNAVEDRLSRGEWRKALEFGERNARRKGIVKADVEKEITASRGRA